MLPGGYLAIVRGEMEAAPALPGITSLSMTDVPVEPSASEAAEKPAEQTKKPRRTLGLAVGLGKDSSVVVQTAGKTSSQ